MGITLLKSNLVLYIHLSVMLIKKTRTSNSFVALPRLHATAVDCAHKLINGESGINRGGELAKCSKIHKRGVLNKVGESGKKRND